MSAASLISELTARGIRLRIESGRLFYDAPDERALTPALRKAISERRSELIRLLQAVPRQASETPRLHALPEGTPAPVSFAQERFIFLDQLEGGGTTYNLSSLFHLRGALAVDAFRDAIGDLCARHTVLRSRFDLRTDPPLQFTSTVAPALELIDATGAPDPAAAAESAAQRVLTAPFDVVNGPHLRLALIRLQADHHLFAVAMHHIVSDGASIMVFVRDLQALYAARLGEAPPPPPLPLQFSDVAAWQRATWSGARLASEAAFWREELKDAPLRLQLPFGASRPARPTRDGYALSLAVPAPLQDVLEQSTRQDGQTLFHLTLSAFALLLLAHGRQEEVVIGVPVANRPDPQLQEMIGPLVNLVPFRLRAGTGRTLGGFVAETRRIAIRLLDHADLPFEQIVQALAPPRDPSHPPLLQAMFVLEDTPVGVMRLPGLSVETAVVEDHGAKYEITLALQRRGTALFCTWKSRESLIPSPCLARLGARYLSILEALATAPGRLLETLTGLMPEEEAAAIDAGRGPFMPIPADVTLHGLVDAQARLAPDAVAVTFGESWLTHADLARWSNALARRLVALGAGPDCVVAIHAERSLAMIAAVLGILKSGAAYLPLEPHHPVRRRDAMLAASGARLLVTHGVPPEDLPSGVTTLAAEDCRFDAAPATAAPLRPAGPDNACSVFFTSGSTGQPKGVVLTHRAMAHNLLWMQLDWPLGTGDSVLYKAAFGFDVSLKEMLWPLMAGARLVVAKPGGQKDPAYLRQVIEAERVSVVHLVPSMLDYFLQHGSTGCSSLRIVMCGGEALSVALRDRFCAAFDALLLHLYGPTEAAIAVTASSWRAGESTGSIVLGRPMPNCDVLVLDAALRPVPEGAVGEIYIGGVALARGYLGDGALTAARFVPHPYSSVPGARLYRTGDLGRRALGGTLSYAGRIDRQVKHRGFRIEIGEIETALRAVPGLREGLVTRRVDRDMPVLAAYGVAEAPGLTPTAIRTALAATLPHYMIPDVICLLDAMPMNANGKADIDALPDPFGKVKAGLGAEALDAAGVESTADTAARVRACWREVMQREPNGDDENFFEAGGHSLMAMRLRARLAEAFGRPVAITDIFSYPTIAGLAAFLDRAEAGPAAVSARAACAAPHAVPGGREIAVIGMAGRFPGADGIEAFRRLLESGQEAIHRFSAAELRAAGVPEGDIANPDYVPARGRLEGTSLFDAAFFRFSNRDADLLDPQIRLILEASQHALDDAGYDAGRLREAGLRVGVYASVSRSSYFLNRLAHVPGLIERVGPQQISVSTDKSFAATHIAYRLGLLGPAMTIDTACSSSLVAIHQACRALRQCEADLMLVAAASVDVPMEAGYFFQAGNIASPDGHCRPFDAAANGTVKGNGGGAVLLKRFDEALRDGDPVLAVVRGSAVNNDGPTKVSYTAPSEPGQRRVIDAALADAGLTPDEITYIEAHGTGTALGDAIEFAALRASYGAWPTYVGGVKASIGHLDAAAGLAGFIKTVLAVSAGRIPPLVNFTAPHPALDLGGREFRFPPVAIDWPEDRPRRAAVSSLGMGGTNAHVILEAPPDPSSAAGLEREAQDRLSLVRLSGASPEALADVAGQLAARLAEPGAPSLPVVAHTLATGRATHRYRAAFAAATTTELAQSLREAEAGWRSNQDARPRPASARAPIFLFGGHGSQHGSMGRNLYSGLAAFRDAADEALAEFVALGLDTLGSAFDPHEAEEARAARLADHVHAQALIFTVAWAAARALMAHNVQPAACVGLSIGEVAAAAIAGAFSLSDAARLAIARARVIANCSGGMLQIAADPELIAAELPDAADIAVIAGGAAVIAGPESCLTLLAARWEARGASCRRLHVGHAAHSRLVEPFLPRFIEEIAGLGFAAPRIPVAANVTGGWLADEANGGQGQAAQYWARQLRQTVRLDACLDAVLDAAPDAPAIEIGPGIAMLASLQRRPKAKGRIGLTTMPGPRDTEPEMQCLLACLGGAWAAGLDPAFPEQVRAETPRRARLPGYPFQRSHHLIDPPTPAIGAQGAKAPCWTCLPPTPRTLPASPVYRICRAGPALAAALAELREIGLRITEDHARADQVLAELSAIPGLSRDEVVANVVSDLAVPPGDPRPVVVMTAGALACLPGESADAGAAVSLAALRAQLGGRVRAVVDLGANQAFDRRALAAALATPAGEICVRGGRCYTLSMRPVDAAPEPDVQPLLPPKRRFLVLDGGGHAAVGVARALAASGAESVSVARLPGAPLGGTESDGAIEWLALSYSELSSWPSRFAALAPLTGIIWAIGDSLAPIGDPCDAAETIGGALWDALSPVSAGAELRLALTENAAGNAYAASLAALCATRCALPGAPPWGLIRIAGDPRALGQTAPAGRLLRRAGWLGLPEIEVDVTDLVTTDAGSGAAPSPASANGTVLDEGEATGRLAALWRDILGAEAEAEADFFAQGGDSLAATHLLSRVNATFGTAIPLAAFFRRPVFAALRSLLRSRADEAPRESFDF